MPDAPTLPDAAALLGLREAADQLGVHYMTAYRYVRTGRLRARKLGAEWRVDPADVAEVMAPRPVGAPRAAYRTRLERRLVAGDEAGAWAVVDAALGSGAEPAEILTGLVVPALRSIGDRWADGELTVADEHRASTVAQRVIARMGPRFARPGRRRGSVVLGSVQGDRHTLPTAILGDLLRGAGLEVADLGADCPAETFLDAVHSADSPCAVGICVTAAQSVDAVPGVIAELRAAALRCPVVVGGGAITDADMATRLGADLWAGPVDEVVDLFVSLAAGTSSSDGAEAAE